MNRTTSLDFTSLSMNCSMLMVSSVPFRDRGLQSERVQRAAHGTLQRSIDQLMLLHTRLAAEALGHDRGGIMIAVAGEVADGHLRIRDRGFDQFLLIPGIQRPGRLAAGR